MAQQTRSSTIKELRSVIRDKDRDLSELDLMLADYHIEHARLIRELRKLHATLRDAEQAASSVSAAYTRRANHDGQPTEA